MKQFIQKLIAEKRFPHLLEKQLRNMKIYLKMFVKRKRDSLVNIYCIKLIHNLQST